MKNFISYIDDGYRLKFALLETVEAGFSVSSVPTAFFPVAVYVDCIKRFGVDILNTDNLFCLSVINDLGDIDLNTIPSNVFFEPNKELTFVVPVASNLSGQSVTVLGNASVDIESSVPLPILRHDVDIKTMPSLKYRPVVPVFVPSAVGEFNKDSNNVMYWDVFMNRDYNTTNQYQRFYRVYNPLTGLCEVNNPVDIMSNKNSSYMVHNLYFRVAPFSGYVFANGEYNTFRIYYDVVNNCFSLSSCVGSVFVPANALVYDFNDMVSSFDQVSIYRFTDPKKVLFYQMKS